MKTKTTTLAAIATGGLFIAGCAPGAPLDPSSPYDGPSVAITISPLELTLVRDVVWDLEVRNGATELVWQKRVTSSGFGDGSGAASYVGPCDADTTDGRHLNTVTVRLMGAYTTAVSPLGGGFTGFGDPAPPNGLELRNPGPLSKVVTCTANADARVVFDVTVLRPAQQGFFDVAVSFSNLFCSAKFDCEKPNGDPIELLFDGSERARTLILAFSCGAGAPGDVNTRLYLDDLVIDCGARGTVTIDPAAADGNYYLGGQWTGVASAGSDPPALFQVAAYKGVEQLQSLDKRYWNVALGVGDADLSGCTLRTRGTADDNGRVIADRVVSAGVVYPFIQWEVPLAGCTQHPVDHPDGRVSVRYTASSLGSADAETPYGDLELDHVFGDFCDDCTLPSGAPNLGGGCSADHHCWTNYCLDGTCTNPVDIDCDFDPPLIPADETTAATLTCTVDDPNAPVSALYVDLSGFGGSDQTPLVHTGGGVWVLTGIVVPVAIEPGQYEADVVTTTPHNRAWAPLQVIVPELFDTDTYMYIYFDSSGSMSTTEPPLNTMKNGVLRDALIKYYNGDITLYNQRVTFIANVTERTFQWMHANNPPGDADRVVVLIFQDEADSHYHNQSATLPSPKSTFVTDMAALRAKLTQADPTKRQWRMLRVGVAAVFSPAHPNHSAGFQALMAAVMNGVTPHTAPEHNLVAWNPAENGGVAPAGGPDALITWQPSVTAAQDQHYYFRIVQQMAERLQLHIPTP